jgi:hypothetical protein
MTAPHSVQTCRWGTPTLFLGWPLWYDASQHEWSCTRGAGPTVLVDPAICRTCPHWCPVEREVEPRTLRCTHRMSVSIDAHSCEEASPK